eukprot:1275052-Prymnesium_polylepis.1
MAYWPSEDYNSNAPPECNYFNFSVVYTSELCSHFVMARSSSTPYTKRLTGQQNAQHFTKANVCFHRRYMWMPDLGLSLRARP